MNKQEIIVLAKSKGLDILENKLKINESGLDFQVAHAEDLEGTKWILRIPRRGDSMNKAKQEKHVLDVVNQHTSIQAPSWSIFTKELIAYKQLDGTPAATVNPELQDYEWTFDSQNSPEAYHQTFGQVLADLHQVSIELVKTNGMTIHSAEEARLSMKARMKKVKDTYGVDTSLWERWQSWVSNEAFWPKYTGLSHGDIHPGHILIDSSCRVTGLIDWTEVAVTDVSRDFQGHYLIFGENGLDKALASYENAGGRTWTHMKEHIIELQTTAAISVAEFAESSGLKEMEEMAKKMLGVSDNE
ncbi:macrolide 2'-phosphotransferase [Bacillus horti]|uniref:Macrolide phosphotransferase n=1 Tax=Caldalkalibacillus horti TaxID=77523 RepID=A0ABT9W5K5_9BACI|nr:macrolide 2'-phosphotransferase [Bacillus horti]MDQ0168349.1 macrolide phosphotransferase [Bacillus horti]